MASFYKPFKRIKTKTNKKVVGPYQKKINIDNRVFGESYVIVGSSIYNGSTTCSICNCMLVQGSICVQLLNRKSVCRQCINTKKELLCSNPSCFAISERQQQTNNENGINYCYSCRKLTWYTCKICKGHFHHRLYRRHYHQLVSNSNHQEMGNEKLKQIFCFQENSTTFKIKGIFVFRNLTICSSCVSQCVRCSHIGKCVECSSCRRKYCQICTYKLPDSLRSYACWLCWSPQSSVLLKHKKEKYQCQQIFERPCLDILRLYFKKKTRATNL